MKPKTDMDKVILHGANKSMKLTLPRTEYAALMNFVMGCCSELFFPGVSGKEVAARIGAMAFPEIVKMDEKFAVSVARQIYNVLDRGPVRDYIRIQEGDATLLAIEDYAEFCMTSGGYIQDDTAN